MKNLLFFMMGIITFGSLGSACGRQKTTLSESSIESIEDASKIERRSDGRFTVTCNDGTTEIRTNEEVTQGFVCTSSASSAVKRCSARFSGSTLSACLRDARSGAIVDACGSSFSGSTLLLCFKTKSADTVQACASRFSGSTLLVCFGAPSSDVVIQCGARFSGQKLLECLQ